MIFTCRRYEWGGGGVRHPVVKSREMTGRSQTVPWWLEGGIKTTENKMHRPRWSCPDIFFSVYHTAHFYPKTHRLNMELHVQSLLRLHVHSSTHWLRTPSLLPHLGSYTRAPLVSQDRRHLFVTPCKKRKNGVYISLYKYMDIKRGTQEYKFKEMGKPSQFSPDKISPGVKLFS
jgi:hypothetical protein